MTTDPLREAADALRQAQDACRAAWDACELALQNVLAAGGLLDHRAGEQIVSTTVTTAIVLGQVADVPSPDQPASGAGHRSAASGLPCEECDLLAGHTIWCSKRWGAE
jgi:hypothetical protein